MNILIYYQNYQRTIYLESLAQSFLDKGHHVFLLTTSESGILHDKMKDMGVSVASHTATGNMVMQLFKQRRFFISYCRKNKIDIVYSHLQFANMIAISSQYFIRARVFPTRHHVDEVRLVGNKNALRIDKLVNKLAKRIIVVSNASMQYMITHENVSADKVKVIPLGYDFARYDKPDPDDVDTIRSGLSCHLVLIVIARMTARKRHIVALEALNQLVNDGLDVKMILLDHGSEEDNLRKFIAEKKLGERVIFTGFLNNTMNYLAAADLILHPSLIESSNQIVKEAALLSKPSIACSGIGDFDEYFRHRENGFLVSIENTADEMYSLVKEYYNKKEELQAMGERMKAEVLRRFDIKTVSEQYLSMDNGQQ